VARGRAIGYWRFAVSYSVGERMEESIPDDAR
jgi:hypothetical protein